MAPAGVCLIDWADWADGAGWVDWADGADWVDWVDGAGRVDCADSVIELMSRGVLRSGISAAVGEWGGDGLDQRWAGPTRTGRMVSLG